MFVSSSLWAADGPSLQLIVAVGDRTDLAPGGGTAPALIARALHSPTFVVASIGAGANQRIAYAVALAHRPRFAAMPNGPSRPTVVYR